MHLFLVIFMSLLAFAQHSEQPQKESDTDLRSSMVIFSIHSAENDKTILLERTPHLDHFLRMKDEDGEEQIRKIDSKSAKRLEMDFASRFLKCQYEIEAIPGACKVSHKLTLKGESQDVCKKDEKKGQEITPMVEALNKRF